MNMTLEGEIKGLNEENARLREALEEAHAELGLGSQTDVQTRLHAHIRELEAAIRWALGETDEFRSRMVGQGPYWWRKELRRRSGLRAVGGEGE